MPNASGTSSLVPAPVSEAAADAADLLALVAQMETTAFLRFAGAAGEALDPERRLHLVRLAAESYERQERVLARTDEVLGGSDAALGRYIAFDGAFDEFNSRTQASGWWEELVKGYVGHGVAYDFCRIVAEALDPASREVVVAAIDGELTTEAAIVLVDEATDEDEQLASRLALWGRRVVGEALSVVQVLLTEHESLQRLLVRAAETRSADGEAPASVTTWLFGQLTAEHARRMGRVGLAA
ncbi:ferritin-like fold-containing protein [Sanguibacter sp. A247]|uniref:ferritin-like fold-containing protein n=1 Tax=unclassified Sanguibacter TaxID=2645534 RepID=UPI003FD6F02B